MERLIVITTEFHPIHCCTLSRKPARIYCIFIDYQSGVFRPTHSLFSSSQLNYWTVPTLAFLQSSSPPPPAGTYCLHRSSSFFVSHRHWQQHAYWIHAISNVLTRIIFMILSPIFAHHNFLFYLTETVLIFVADVLILCHLCTVIMIDWLIIDWLKI